MATQETSSDGRPPPSAARPLFRALYVLLGVALLLVLLFQGALAYVRTPGGTARLVRLGLGAANEAILGHIEAKSVTIRGSHVVVLGATLVDSEGALVASIDRVDADMVFLSLLRGHIEARTLTLTRPTFRVVLDEEGSNLDRTFSARHPGPVDPEGKPAPLTFIVQKLDLEQGRVSVQTPGGPPFLLQTLALEGAGQYALRSRDFQLEARGNGALDTPLAGPFTLSVRGNSHDSTFNGDVDVRAAGASVVLDVRRTAAQPLDGHVALDVPPALARALLRGWPLRVPLLLTADAHHVGTGFLVSGQAAAGRARVALQADVDVAAAAARTLRLEAQHLDVLQLFGRGPPTDFSLRVRGEGGGESLSLASGNLHLSIPATRVRGVDVGPVEASARVQDGRVDVSALRAVLPGLTLEGQGRGSARSLEGSLSLEVRDLQALNATLGEGVGALPRLAGHGSLHLQLSGRPSHPGVEATGQFPSLDVGAFSARGLDVHVRLPDVARPTDANADVTASLLGLAGRSLRDVHALLHSEERAVDVRVTSGTLQLSLTGTADADARGLLLEKLDVEFPEEAFHLKAPAALRFDGHTFSVEHLALLSGTQSLALTGGLSAGRLEAALDVTHLDLARLPAVLAPASLQLSGLLSVGATAHGPEAHPDVTLRAQLEGGGWHGLRDVDAHLEAARTGERLSLSFHLLALGTQLDADVEAPEEALRRRIHLPVSLHLTAEGLDVARVLCAVAGAGLVPSGCPGGTAVATGHLGLVASVQGFADGPTLHLALDATEASFRGLSAPHLTLQVDADERTPLRASLSGEALGGSLAVKTTLEATTLELLARRRSWAGWRTLPLTASVSATHLALASAQTALASTRDMAGTLDVQAALSGTLEAPRGSLDVQGHGLVFAPLPEGEVHLAVTAGDALVATLTLAGAGAGAGGEKGQVRLEVGAPLSEFLGSVSAEALARARLSVRGNIGPFALQELPLDANRLRRDRRLLDGDFQVAFEGQGTLSAPVLDVTLKASQLGPKDGAHFQGTAHLHSASGKHALRVQLVSQSGGTLDLDASVQLDVSLEAVRRGLHLAEAPLQAELHSVRFEPDFVASVLPWMRSISGKLEVAGHAAGTLGRPELQGSIAWTDGALGVIGFGAYQNIQLKAQASNNGFAIDELSARVQGGTLSLQLKGARAASDFQVQGSLRTSNLPVVFDDQLWCIATTRVELAGTAREWELDLTQVRFTQAELQLPEARRKNLQGLAAPKDVILTRHGVPLDAVGASRALALDPRRRGEAATGPGALRDVFLRMALLAPNHIAVRSKDVTLELALSDPFQVDLGDAVRLSGEVRIVRGRGDVFGRRFEVQPGGQVSFSGPPEQAQLDVTGVYTSVQSQAKVYMHFSGEVTNVKITPSSDPPLPASEIYTLLATGRTQLAQSSVGSSSALGSGGDAGASILGSWAATQLKNAVGVALPIDVLSVEVGSDERGYNQTRLEAGKYLTDDIYIGYQGRTNADPFRYQNSNAIRVEYRFLRRWSLQLEYGDANAGSLDAIWSRDY